MILQINAFANDTGLPLFIRTKNFNEIDTVAATSTTSDNDTAFIQNLNDLQLNLSTVFYGLNQFSQLNDCLLNYANTDGRTKIKWKCQGNVLFIIFSNVYFIENNHLDLFIDLIIYAIQITCGPKVLLIDNFDKQKCDLKQSYLLIDYLLSISTSMQIERINSISCTINYAPIKCSKMIEFISNFINRLESIKYWALLVNGKLTATNKDWYQLTEKMDAFLIYCLALLSTEIELTSTKTIDIYLPQIDTDNFSKLILSSITDYAILCLIGTKNFSPEEEIKLVEQLKMDKANDDDGKMELSIQCQLSMETSIDTNQLKKFSAFIIFNWKNKIYLIYKEKIILKYLEEMITFCDINGDDDANHEHDDDVTESKSIIKQEISSYYLSDNLQMYKISNRKFLLCTLFELDQISINTKMITLLTNTLFNIFVNKNKSFWY